MTDLRTDRIRRAILDASDPGFYVEPPPRDCLDRPEQVFLRVDREARAPR